MLFPYIAYYIEVHRSLHPKLSKTPVENNNPTNNIFCIPKSTNHPTNKKPHLKSNTRPSGYEHHVASSILN